MHKGRLQPDQIPRHVAIIMDGNGRWAESRGKSRLEGHRQGLSRVRDVVRAANELSIEYLTLYAFSLENWNRPRLEVDGLMSLLMDYLATELDEVDRNGIQLRTIGHKERLPPSVAESVDVAVERTRENKNMVLTFALSYGGRTEIVDAARRLARDAELGKIDPEGLDEKGFAAYLYAPDLPDPDLLIRTGAEQRVSNFLLWQIAYSELHLSERMWPEFRRAEFEAAVVDYQRRERRFGLTSEQVRLDEGSTETTKETSGR